MSYVSTRIQTELCECWLQPLRPIARSGGSLEPSTLEELGHARPSHVGDKRSGQVAFDSPSEDFHLASKAARVTPSRSPHRPNKKQKNISLASLGTRHNADGQPAPWQVRSAFQVLWGVCLLKF